MRGEVRPQWDLAGLAGDQHGIVRRGQLRGLGYSEAAIDRAADSGRLHQLHRGVYAVGHTAIGDTGRCLAAVLACGSGALLSHGSATWLWGLSGRCPNPAHVTVPARGHPRRKIAIHHSTILEDQDRALVDGIPVTAIPRTLLDLAAGRYSRQLSNAIDRAKRIDLLDLDATDELLDRSGRHRGRRRLALALEIYRDPGFTRSRAELLFLALVKEAGLPRPATNVFVAGHEVDAYWEPERFAVEVDGWDTHRTRAAFESDRVRQEDLKLAGIDSIRLTARRIEREPVTVAKRLAALLVQRRGSV